MARLAERSKTVHDTVHGSLNIEGVFLELLDSAEFQRLHGIHQLGLANLVFPGANHTRLEHSLGVWHIGTSMARAAGVDAGAGEIAAACLLHDLGHPPFSHTFEYILHDRLGIDHEETTRRIITGGYDILREGERLPGRRSVPSILEDAGLDPERVARYIRAGEAPRPDGALERFGSGSRAGGDDRTRLGQILHGPLDADQLDYLLRDSRYTGVAYGVIDLPRLLRTMVLHGGRLVIRKQGLAAVESTLVARSLMFSSVYFHKTVRICEMMMARAVERMEGLEDTDLPRLVDSELLALLSSSGRFQRDIVTRLKYRRLFKKAFTVPVAGLEEGTAGRLARLADPSQRRTVEDEIARKAGVEEGYVIVDLPSREVLFSEPRMRQTGVLILDEERKRLEPLSRHSPLARALQNRPVPDWAVMVSTDARSRSKVAEAARRVLA
ncbi:MAG: HD domain-containing protein [Euryarchaeota archaeon]|nr:HD domain-containing protein [Euryarchaeota archaeon]